MQWCVDGNCNRLTHLKIWTTQEKMQLCASSNGNCNRSYIYIYIYWYALIYLIKEVDIYVISYDGDLRPTHSDPTRLNGAQTPPEKLHLGVLRFVMLSLELRAQASPGQPLIASIDTDTSSSRPCKSIFTHTYIYERTQLDQNVSKEKRKLILIKKRFA